MRYSMHTSKNYLIAASVTLLLFCSSSLAHAQETTAQQQPATRSSTTKPADPDVLVKSMTPEQCEQIVLEWRKAQYPNAVPEQMKEFKESFEKMTASQQQKLAAQAMTQWQQYLRKFQNSPESNRVLPNSIQPTDTSAQ